ncbi:hypothetical protein AYI68_g4059 [Smittium mucronatum]|uniref:Uncharacterized protein n=1 Tax=Smittium mucronatum TaxID=133383 RepID=A0A1R0GY57_9FUNG|nr:hypothetical protein AYI68_g4059 [Smittium mucronatum]
MVGRVIETFSHSIEIEEPCLYLLLVSFFTSSGRAGIEVGFLNGILSPFSTMFHTHRLSVSLDHADFNIARGPPTGMSFIVPIGPSSLFPNLFREILTVCLGFCS